MLKKLFAKARERKDAQPKLYRCNYSVRIKNLNGEKESFSLVTPLPTDTKDSVHFRPEPDLLVKDKASGKEFAYWHLALDSHHSATFNQFFQIISTDPSSFNFGKAGSLSLPISKKRLKLKDASQPTLIPEKGDLSHFQLEKEFVAEPVKANGYVPFSKK